MNAEQKKQTKLFAVLLILMVAVAVWQFGPSLWHTTTATVTTAEKVAKVASLPSVSNAKIRQDLLEAKNSQDAVGRRNVFQYYVPPKPPPPPPPPALPPVTRPADNRPPAPPPAPPTPFSALTTFKFDGVGIVAKPGKLVASIFDNTNHWYVSEGDFILGRYRINRVTETSVEIEDVDQNRRQTYTRITTL